MRPSHPSAVAFVGYVAWLLIFSGLAARAAAPATAALGESFRPVEATPVSGTFNPRHALIARSTLTAAETSAPMTFDIALKMRNFAELKARVEKGEHVSAQEMATKYEPTASDYQAVADWLTSQGMTIKLRDPHHMAIFVQATVSRIAKAVQVRFARVAYRGDEFTSAVTTPIVPGAIAPLLVGINGLQPHLHPRSHIVRPADSSGAAGYTPAQIAQAYQATGLYNNGINGAGQTIAIVIDTVPLQSDLTAFWSKYGIAQSISNFTFINVVGGQLPAGTSEETLDTEWSSAMAPGAKVRVYATTTLGFPALHVAYTKIYQDASTYGIHQMSMSYGEGELETTTAEMITDDQYFTVLANSGVTCFASSGDDGATPGENGELEADSPASDPNVIGVGGTSLTDPVNPNPANEYPWNEGPDGGATGGGISDYWPRPSWQTGSGVPGVAQGQTAYRLVPDLACAGDPDYGADFYFDGASSVIGGTSWSCPTCAGFCALINQARTKMGLPIIGSAAQFGALIYPLIGMSSLRDIVAGNNATDSSGSTNGVPNWTAGPGYDLTTGVGVPLVTALAGVAQASVIATVDSAQNATITVRAIGSPKGYQWQRLLAGSQTWSNLGDQGAYSGTATATLAISNATNAMSGDQFQCVVTYAATTMTSAQPTTLVVENPWIISTLAGDVGTSGLVNGAGSAAEFNYPTGIAVDASGNVFVADLDNNNIREVTPGGVVSTPYGSPTGLSGSTNGKSALFNSPRDIAIDGAGNLYVADEGNNLIRKIASGTASTLAASTTFNAPRGVAVDGAGDVFVADSGNNVIREIPSGGSATIIAGSTAFTAGYNDAQGTSALFNLPIAIAVNTAGTNVYVGDYSNECIRKITFANYAWTVSTLAGKPGIAGCLDGTGTQARFNVPRGLAVDSSGDVFVTDSVAPGVVQNGATYSGNNLLREISPTGVVTTIAGQATGSGYADGLGSTALLYNPCGVTIGPKGFLYFAEAGNNAIRMAYLDNVSLSATVPYAAAVVPQSGQFTVTRSGNVASDLTLNYSTANSTAVAGADYDGASVPGSVTIPAGQTSATIAVDPLANPNPATCTLQLALTASTATIEISKTAYSGTVTIIEAHPLTFATWQTNHPDPATPLGDGVSDVEKYAFDINPSLPITTAEREALPTAGMTTVGTQTYLTLTYRENAGLSGTTTITPLMSTDLVNWSTSQMLTPTVIGIDATTQDPIMQVAVPYSMSGPEFLRLNISP